jgi:hypothetical protein
MRAWMSVLGLVGCGGPPTVAEELGVTGYLGATVASETATDGAGVVTTTFDPASGPRCMRGDPFRMATREGAGDDLMVFLQGGGACWSAFCFAITKAPAGLPDIDVLNPALPGLPVADWDVAYLPYCDGSLFAGDAEVDEDGDGATDRWHRGLANLSAGLDVAKETFPHPKRVLLAGSSGGGFGTILAVSLVRHQWPDAEILVFSDSGVGVARGASDAGFLQSLLDEHGSGRFVPPDCPDCLAGGHITPLVSWWLGRDERTRVGVYSSWYDLIIGRVFLQVPPEQFQADVAEQTRLVRDAFPDRYHRLLEDGATHTTLLGDPTGIVGTDLSAVEIPASALTALTSLDIGSLEEGEVAGVRVVDWLAAWIDGEVGQDLVEPPGAPPWAL